MHHIRVALGALMILHGIAHLPGVIGSWRLAELQGISYHTVLLGGRLDVGDGGMRVMGLLWLVAGLGFCVAGFSAILGMGEWATVAMLLAALSLLLSALEWPAARIGVALNLIILAALLSAHSHGWITLVSYHSSR